VVAETGHEDDKLYYVDQPSAHRNDTTVISQGHTQKLYYVYQSRTHTEMVLYS
jgi:hypothetical protein